jgi:SAM-dependent methyltransferase
MNKKSLDLGCNNRPRNPYQCEELYGVDLENLEIENVIYRRANLSLESIPFEDNYFDYVTAFDFIEHIPRILLKNENTTRFPFIELMNEVWRVLKPGGVFYAITPFYPHDEAFQDPTHVNIITKKTHQYFCGNQPMGEIYGFVGQFEKLEVKSVIGKMYFTREETADKFWNHLKYKVINRRKFCHLMWELKAIK